MGQYYTVFILDDNGGHIRHPSEVNCGYKLTEHGHITSPFVNVVLREILNTPKRIAWVGDYALEKSSRTPQRIKDKIKEFKANDEYMECEPYPCELPINKIEECNGFFLLNHDKREYVDLEKYVQRNARVRLWRDRCADDIDFCRMTVFCMSPLALLTACGNGTGGGDYDGSDLRAVGSWAFDRIELIKPKDYRYAPEGYKLINPRFIESYYDDLE